MPSLSRPLLGLVVAAHYALAAPPCAGEPADDILGPGARSERLLAGGESHSFSVVLDEGQYLRVLVEQQGVDAVLSLRGSGGETLLSVDSPNERRGPESLSWIATATGRYRLLVTAADKNAPLGRYVLVVEALRLATADDRQRAAADAQWIEAARLFNARSRESLRSALDLARAAAEQWGSLADTGEQTRALYLMGLLDKQLGDAAAARALFERTLAIRRALGDLPGQADSSNQLGLLQLRAGESSAALSHFGEALALWRQASDPDGEVRAIGNIALALQSTGRLREALEGYREAVPIMQATGHPGLGTTLNNLGGLHDLLGEPHQALDCYEAALALFRAQGRRRSEAELLSNLGLVQRRLGRVETALGHYREALSAARETGNLRLEAAVLDNLGQAYLTLGSIDEGLDHIQQALALQPRVGDRRQQATLRLHLGQANLALGRPRPALELLREAAREAEALQDRRGQALALVDIGAAHAVLGELDEALARLVSADALFRDAADRRGRALVLDRTARVHRARHDDAAAERCFQEAVALWTEARDPLRRAESLQGLAEVESERGRLGEAIGHLEATIEAIESVRAGVARQDLRMSFLASNRELYESYVELLMRRHTLAPGDGWNARAFQASERFRARTLLDMLSGSGVDVRGGGATPLADRLQIVHEAIGALAGRDPGDEPGGATQARALALDRLLREGRELEVLIRDAHPASAALIRLEPLDVATIRETVLDADTVLLEYLLGERRSFLWVVSRESLKSFELPSRDRIEALVRQVREAWSGPAQDGNRGAMTALSRILLEPIMDLDLPRESRLAIVADGALQYLPFAALPIPTPASRDESRAPRTVSVLERHEVVSLPSASALSALRRELGGRARAPRTLAVLADPVFDPDDARVRAGGPPGAAGARLALKRSVERFPRLHASRREAQALVALDPAGSRIALDFEASRELAKATELGSFRYLHFATHGVLDTRRPELSGIVLSLVDRTGRPIDGFLRLHEIFDLRLAADLVTLSACETALGQEIHGEGLVGLARGFMHAGAPRVVASLWKVPDVATSQLMRTFYAGMLQQGLTPAAALRQAQRTIAGEPRWRHPYFWAGFVLQGEWRR